MFTVKTFSEEAKKRLAKDAEMLTAMFLDNKSGKVNGKKYLEYVFQNYSDGEEIVNDRALPEQTIIAFEVARKCLLVKGAYSGNIQFFWYSDELTHWVNRNFQGDLPTRASDWFQWACLVVYDAVQKGTVITRETVKTTKNALGNTLFYMLCQATQRLSDTRDDRMAILDIYGVDDKEPSVVIPYRDRYFADSIRESLMQDKDYTEGLSETDRAILDMLYEHTPTREIVTALNSSKGTIDRRIKELRKRFEGVLLQYNNR